MKILPTLVIGSRGQLAIALRQQLPTSVALSHLERLDLSDPSSLEAGLERIRPSLVVNAGAYTAVDRAESEPALAHAINATGPEALARWCERSGAVLVHISTDYVFDGSKPAAYVETDPVAPLNVYGRTKLAGEEGVRRALHRHLILRTSWVFSAYGQNFVRTMLRLAGERDELRVVADQRGRPTAAAELARVIWLLTERFAAIGELPWGTYHFASAGATSWHGLASAIVETQAEYSSRRPLVTAIASADFPTPARRPLNSELDTSLFERTFDIQPRPWLDDLQSVVAELSRPVPAR